MRAEIEERIFKLYELIQLFHNQNEPGYGPFAASIYQGDKEICHSVNLVQTSNCSTYHAEMMVINEAHRIFNNYDLSQYKLTLYSSAEPCMMCAGGIMWSGIKEVYFGIKTEDVESIAGFYEGPKANDWIKQFKNRGIIIKGGFLESKGRKVLREYVEKNHKIY